MPIAVYCRVSTNEQDLEQQIEACKRFCAFKGFEIGKIFSDVGSGKDFFRRPAFNDMLQDLRAMKFQGIVVFRFDRLGRNAVECVKFFEEMESKGIEIYSLNESLDTSTAIGRAVRDIILRLAQLERENISEATKQRLQALKNMGRHLGRPIGKGDSRPRKRSGYYGNANASNKGGSKNPDLA